MINSPAREELLLHLKNVVGKEAAVTIIEEYKEEILNDIRQKLVEKLKNPDSVPRYNLTYTCGNNELISTETVNIGYIFLAIQDIFEGES